MGDRVAFATIYNRFYSALYIHALYRLKDKTEAEDLVQDLFIHLWNRRDSLIVTNISHYLYASVRNRILDIIAHRAVESKYMSTLPAAIVVENCIADHRLRERQLADIISREIASLPPKMREVFELSRIHNLSHKEIAQKLGISEHSVRSHVKNALRILRGRLGIMAWLFLLIRH